jgi:3-dehydroquinate synthase
MNGGDSTSLRVSFELPCEYTVHFTEGVFDPDNPVLLSAVTRREPARRHRLFVVVDEGVDRAHPGLGAAIRRYTVAHAASLSLVAEPFVVPGGERVKNEPAVLASLQAQMAAARIDRQSYCLVIGGGAVQDMAGFAAATLHRGVRVIRLPTTVLSQNDSGVGVKNGVNAFGTKNFLGSFAIPFSVICDARFLDTLERRDRIAGMAEAVKVGLVRDAGFFDWLCRHERQLADLEPAATSYMIRHCARLHVEHIAGCGDPFEQGSARPLDLGHWAAHKLESLTEHRLRHGEAVAIGLALDTRYSVEKGLLPAVEGDRIVSLLSGLGFRLHDEAMERRGSNGQLLLLDGLREFREHLGGELCVSLLRAPGQPLDVHEMDAALISRSIAWLTARYRDAA